MQVNKALHIADKIYPTLPNNLGTLIAYRDIIVIFQNEAQEMQRRHREEMEGLLVKIKAKSNRVRNLDARNVRYKRALEPPANLLAPSTGAAPSTPAVSPSINFPTNLGEPREQTESQDLISSMNRPDRSSSDERLAGNVRQGTSEAAIQMISMATEKQAPHINIPDPPRAPTESSSQLSKKRKISTPKDPAKFQHVCNACGERFTRSTTLREHKRTHTDERPFPCSICPKTFARSKDRNRHQALHAGKNKFSCDLSFCEVDGQCGRAFAREDGLVAHLRTERGWKCLQSIMNDGKFEYYARKYGTTEGLFRCNLTRLACGADFNHFADLRTHLEEPENRQCVVEWLVKEFVGRIREDRAEREDRSSTTSDSEDQHPSSPRQRSLQLMTVQMR